jgi:hypothetical protein
MRNLLAIVLVVSLLTAALPACKAGNVPTPDTQATVNAAVAATGTSQAGVQATVNAAVKATTAAPTPTRASVATATAAAPTPAAAPKAPTVAPTPTPMDYATMSEEELAALIDQAVAEAVVSTQQSSDAATSATADSTITQQEAAALLAYVMNAEQAITYAEELIDTYYGLYADLATETLAVLQATDQDLAAMEDSIAALNATLTEINKALSQGLALAEQTLAQLNAAAKNASDKAAQAQAEAQNWTKSLPADLDKRATAALAVKPTQIASNRQGAISSAFDYLDAVRQAMDDNKITVAELAQIAQLGANASAGLKALGGPSLQQASSSIDMLTSQLARGQVPQAKAGLGSLEASLGARPPKLRP